MSDAAIGEDGSSSARAALQAIDCPEDYEGQVIASEEFVANPVAIALDERQRIFVAETFRQMRGVDDMRGHMDWLLDDLSARTVEDRLAYLKKHLQEGIASYTEEEDRIRLLEDTDGDRVIDRDSIFADGFNDVLMGTGADVRPFAGSVYYTCIPDLWRLEDQDDDGVADVLEIMHHGFGVRTAFRGHDMHGLQIGPDGRLYFSIGDRGLNVVTKEGKRVELPDRGAVLRCELDGSQLEVFASGLRNPQDLAFDQFGNLFTVDNNSDHADQARVTYIVQGAEVGWRMFYQYLPDRGPWVRERLWEPAHEGQAAYIVPPIANYTAGPSGFAFHPGVGMPRRYDGHFFICDFTGTPATSGVKAFALEPMGAFFRMVDEQDFVMGVLTTDVEFAQDGSLYVADWISSWAGVGQGRIFRFAPRAGVVELPKPISLLNMEDRPTKELLDLLSHPDQRVRQRSQFALAQSGKKDELLDTALHGSDQLARIHALWGLGQIARRANTAERRILPLLDDEDPEIRAQVAKLFSDMPRDAPLRQPLISLLQDDSARVRFFAALALARQGVSEDVEPLLTLLQTNADRDLLVRHAVVQALAAIGDVPQMLDALAHRKDNSRSERLGVLLALRNLQSPEVARFLEDEDGYLVLEAARAIHDLPIEGAMPELAHLSLEVIARVPTDAVDPLSRRVLNACYRLGESAPILAYLESAELPTPVRTQAWRSLLEWENPRPLDLVLGEYRPLPQHRDTAELTASLREKLPVLLRTADVQVEEIKLVARYGLAELAPVLDELVRSEQAPTEIRVAAMQTLGQLGGTNAAETARDVLRGDSGKLRAAALEVLVASESNDALRLIQAALERGEIQEKQDALRLLTRVPSPQATELLGDWLEKLKHGQIPAEIQLDLLSAARENQSPEIQDRLVEWQAAFEPNDALAPYRVCMAGGDTERGRQVFFEKVELSCSRCHKAGEPGIRVGPNLSAVGKERTREYLLESIVSPNAQIAKGYETTVLITDEGQTISGVVQDETADAIELMLADGTSRRINKSAVEVRTTGNSAMPTGLEKQLSLAELRDLIEFLASMQGLPPETGGHE